mmetsp:Transcript_30759/g.70946  ORF Transcript_30759/g.70946 Transcript_30759/m.70946 type:complete len:246 (-) Transcript_30759:389-1126(-)
MVPWSSVTAVSLFTLWSYVCMGPLSIAIALRYRLRREGGWRWRVYGTALERDRAALHALVQEAVGCDARALGGGAWRERRSVGLLVRWVISQFVGVAVVDYLRHLEHLSQEVRARERWLRDRHPHARVWIWVGTDGPHPPESSMHCTSLRVTSGILNYVSILQSELRIRLAILEPLPIPESCHSLKPHPKPFNNISMADDYDSLTSVLVTQQLQTVVNSNACVGDGLPTRSCHVEDITFQPFQKC